MTVPAHAVQVELQVPFHDCDPLALVWHGRYFEYLEASRCALLKSCNLDVADLIELQVRMVVSEAHCHYSTPLRYGDVACVTAWFSEYSPLLRVAYHVDNLTTERRSARAYTALALTDNSGKLLAEIPAAVRKRLPQ